MGQYVIGILENPSWRSLQNAESKEVKVLSVGLRMAGIVLNSQPDIMYY